MHKIYEVPPAYYNALFFQNKIQNFSTDLQRAQENHKNLLREKEQSLNKLDHIVNLLNNQQNRCKTELTREKPFISKCADAGQNLIDFSQIVILPGFLLSLLLYDRNFGFLTKCLALLIYIVFLTVVWSSFKSKAQLKKIEIDVLEKNSNYLLTEIDNKMKNNSGKNVRFAENINSTNNGATINKNINFIRSNGIVTNGPIITEISSDTELEDEEGEEEEAKNKEEVEEEIFTEKIKEEERNLNDRQKNAYNFTKPNNNLDNLIKFYMQNLVLQ